jgi:hypothetical protein
MIWFFLLFGLAIAIPSMLLLTGLAVAILALPFLALLSIGIVVVGCIFSLVLWPVTIFLFDPLVALILAVLVARYFLTRAPLRSPVR